jgi:hypothetical protein
VEKERRRERKKKERERENNFIERQTFAIEYIHKIL